MTRDFAEILLIIPTAFCAGFLMFVAGVIQGAMNDMDEAGFKRFMASLYRHAVRSPYAIIVSSVTFVGAVPYFIFFGFGHGWFTAGIALHTVTSIVSKSLNLPIYNRIAALESGDAERLREERRKLQNANRVRAVLQFVTVVLMVIGLA